MGWRRIGVVEKLEYWSNGSDLKGFPKPLRSFKNGRLKNWSTAVPINREAGSNGVLE